MGKKNINLMLEPWDKVTTMGAEELQTRITMNLEKAVCDYRNLPTNIAIPNIPEL